jgi:hypothetical protein
LFFFSVNKEDKGYYGGESSTYREQKRRIKVRAKSGTLKEGR